MFSQRKISIERFEKALSRDYWSDVNLQSILFKERKNIEEIGNLFVQSFEYSGEDQSIPLANRNKSFEEIKDGDFEPCSVGDSFGPSWSTHWFLIEISVPETLQTLPPHHQLRLEWDSSSEGMLYSEEGEPLQGFTGGFGCDRRSQFVLLNQDQEVKVFVEMAANEMFGCGKDGLINPPDPDRSFQLKSCGLVAIDLEGEGLFLDFKVVADLAKHLPEEDPLSGTAIRIGNNILNHFNCADRNSWLECRAMARELFEEREEGKSLFSVTCSGHCHIDTAWLWPFRETRRKVARSWVSVLRMLEEWEGKVPYCFCASQSVQYKWLLEDHPSIFNKLKTEVTKGNFVPVGGSYVEFDANIPSGESFIRSLMFGQRFFENTFGERCSVFFLPDTFGYSSQLPQLLSSAGMNNFITQKLSWNLVNSFPHSTFYWDGLDGSRVLVHFPPADTYNAQADVRDAIRSVKGFKNKDTLSSSLMLYGNGDGGGGPLPSHLEQLKRISSLPSSSSLPNIKFASPNDFFLKLREEIESGERNVPIWSGELYLELHQGTFTSQAWTKKYNRMCEVVLHDLELVLSWLCVLGKLVDGDERRNEVNLLWEDVLLNTFHDCIPGSSIGLVYEDMHHSYETTLDKAQDMLVWGLDQLMGDNQEEMKEGKEEEQMMICNLTPFERFQVIQLQSTSQDSIPSFHHDISFKTERRGRCSLHSDLGDEDIKRELVIVRVPPFSISPIDAVTIPINNPLSLVTMDSGFEIENEFFRTKIDSFGRVSSFVVLGGEYEREMIQPGKYGNEVFRLTNTPFFWDAWDVMPYANDTKVSLASCCLSPDKVTSHILEQTPQRISIRFDWEDVETASSMSQIIWASACSPILHFDTTVDWHENRRMLKVDFPFHLHTSSATFEVQFGKVERPTHTNTSHDWAKYEVCGHRFACLSEAYCTGGVVNDCKYGWTARGQTLSLSLLRAPKAPDEMADMGIHRFRYGLVAFQGLGKEEAERRMVREGILFNSPLHSLMTSSPTPKLLPITLSAQNKGGEGVVISTMKVLEDSNNGILVRLYESLGGRGKVSLEIQLPISEAKETNILEDPITNLPITPHINGWTVDIPELLPYQVKSIVLIR